MLPQGFARSVNVCLDLPYRHAQRVGDLLIAGLLKMEEDERNALVRR
jgi:hypothetical protein